MGCAKTFNKNPEYFKKKFIVIYIFRRNFFCFHSIPQLVTFSLRATILLSEPPSLYINQAHTKPLPVTNINILWYDQNISWWLHSSRRQWYFLWNATIPWNWSDWTNLRYGHMHMHIQTYTQITLSRLCLGTLFNKCEQNTNIKLQYS